MTSYYDQYAPALATTYESIQAEKLNAWLCDALPASGGCVLDVGAGSGRDAAWLASLGHDVVAVEPSTAMVREANRLHPESGIHWIQGDRLPGLEKTLRHGKAYDLILLSAVWMHVAPADRSRAFRKLVTLLKPGARIAMTLRHGPAAVGQDVHDVKIAEIEQLCRAHGTYIERLDHAVPDALGRPEVTWSRLLLRLPDDGTGALPLLRHIILNDQKSSTYKPALLRALCRIADGAAGMARFAGETTIAIPLGLVALYWLRLYKPLLAAGLPQAPSHEGLSGLGFVKDGYRGIQHVSPLDLQPGQRFDPSTIASLHKALGQAAAVIHKMPAQYIRFADGTPVFPVVRKSRPRLPSSGLLDEAYLCSFGELRVPVALWMALQRHAIWVEPAVEAEWVRQMGVAAGSRKALDQQSITEAMRWIDPDRDQKAAREVALEIMDAEPVLCIWTARPLTPRTLEIDHCLPWSLWPCSDLWNLLPAHRTANRRKRNYLPSAALLRRRATQITKWWERGYLSGHRPALSNRFECEVRATLPTLGNGPVSADEIFSGLLLQQMRLRHDQQAQVWEGV